MKKKRPQKHKLVLKLDRPNSVSRILVICDTCLSRTTIYSNVPRPLKWYKDLEKWHNAVWRVYYDERS